MDVSLKDHPVTQALLAFALTKPADETYSYTDPQKCPLAQTFIAKLGAEVGDIAVLPLLGDHDSDEAVGVIRVNGRDTYDYPHALNKVLNVRDTGATRPWGMPTDEWRNKLGWTWGKLVQRLQAL